jgi:hypothetical protein
MDEVVIAELERRAGDDPALADEVLRRILSGNGVPVSPEVADREIGVLKARASQGDPKALDELSWLAEKTYESLVAYDRMCANAER